MRVDQKGLDLIKAFEGCRLTAYKCVSTEKYYTIGYGHYGADVTQGMRITQERAEQLLQSDLVRFENTVNSAVKVLITQSMFNALVSFCYNVGQSAFKNSTLLKLLNKGKYNEACQQFARWNKSGGKVLTGLVNRRTKEKKEFLRMGIPTCSEGSEVPSLKGYKGFSIVDGLKAYGYQHSFSYRKTLWAKLGFGGTYKGTAMQNTKMLNYLKSH